VTRDGRVVTRKADNHILSGITRAVLMNVLEALQLRLEERAFTPDESYEAAEAFVTSASQIVMPVVKIDDRMISDGEPGPISRRLREEFHRFAEVS
jgi:D-alanine transaminase